MKNEDIIKQSAELMGKATKSYTDKSENKKESRTITENYIRSLEEVIDRVGLNGTTLETEINIPEIFIDKDKETQNLIKILGRANSKPELYGISVEFKEGSFTTKVGGEITIDGETYKTQGEDMGILRVITTVKDNVNLELLKSILRGQ